MVLRGAVEDAPDLGRQLLAAVGLAQELDAGVEPAVMDDRILGIARGEQHPEPRPQPGRALGEDAAADLAGHHHVGQQQIDLGAVFEDRQRLRPTRRLDDGKTEFLQHRRDGFAHDAVVVECVTAAGLWNATVDPSEFQAAVLNLAINGRDAMPGGGKLTIELGNAALDDAYAARHAEVEPGQYVMFAITDTGKGMDAATMERALDPFFTTKPPGEGTGLGLPQVYGLVKQTGGHLKIYSEVGEGTTVKLYLPRGFGEESA